MDKPKKKKISYSSQNVKLTYCGLQNDITGYGIGKSKPSKVLGEFALRNKGY